MKTKEQTARDVLLEVRALLAEPTRWTKGAYGKDARGVRVGARSSNAVCWCLVGAYQHSHPEGTSRRRAFDLLGSVASDWHGRSLQDFNDDPATTHADVLALIDRALELTT